jgi:hypothetical protein
MLTLFMQFYVVGYVLVILLRNLLLYKCMQQDCDIEEQVKSKQHARVYRHRSTQSSTTSRSNVKY